MPNVGAEPSRVRTAPWWWVAGGAIAVALSFVVAPPALSYDPEAWLLWGRETVEGRLDVTAGPAIKPLPIGWNALVVAAGGSDVAWVVWAVVGRASLAVALVLGAAVAGHASGSRRAWTWVAGAAAVVATPTMLGGALGGGSEIVVAAALFGACLLGRAGRLGGATILLAAAALLRPEALVLSAAVGVLWIARERPGGWAAAGAFAFGTAVLAAWAGLQWAGGGDLAGGAAAAAALRDGQPGLASRPALATLGAAAFVVPWLLAAAVAWAARGGGAATRPARMGGSVEPAGPLWPPPAAWPLVLGALWVVTVALMAELGFSGESRYLAPGLALLTVGAVGVIAHAATPVFAAVGGPARTNFRRWETGAATLSVAMMVVLAGWQFAPAIRGQRALAASQEQLSGLLGRPAVQAAAASCDRLAVPRFLRPAVAWRLERPIGSLQSPSLRGAECAIRRHARGNREPHGPGGQLRAREATSGRWSWWRTVPENAEG